METVSKPVEAKKSIKATISVPTKLPAKRVSNTVLAYNEQSTWFDIDKLAYAVAMSETHNCTKWYWLQYNNCFWIKNWNTAPCDKIGNNRMCIYNDPEESYIAFKKIWSTWYKIYPTRRIAERWTWKDNATNWLYNVWHYYNK